MHKLVAAIQRYVYLIIFTYIYVSSFLFAWPVLVLLHFSSPYLELLLTYGLCSLEILMKNILFHACHSYRRLTTFTIFFFTGMDYTTERSQSRTFQMSQTNLLHRFTCYQSPCLRLEMRSRSRWASEVWPILSLVEISTLARHVPCFLWKLNRSRTRHIKASINSWFSHFDVQVTRKLSVNEFSFVCCHAWVYSDSGNSFLSKCILWGHYMWVEITIPACIYEFLFFLILKDTSGCTPTIFCGRLDWCSRVPTAGMNFQPAYIRSRKRLLLYQGRAEDSLVEAIIQEDGYYPHHVLPTMSNVVSI